MHITYIRTHALTRSQALAYLHDVTPMLAPHVISALLTAAFTRASHAPTPCYDVARPISSRLCDAIANIPPIQICNVATT